MLITDDGTGQGSAKPERRLSIEMFGHFAVRYDGRDVVLSSRKARALMGYLAVSDGGEETRERLVGLLWSESDEEHARASLRQSLYEIREALRAVEFDGFKTDKLAASIDRSALDVDVWEVRASAQRGQPDARLLVHERITDRLLEDFETLDESFRSWLLAKRQSLHDRLIANLEDALRGQTDGPAPRNDEPLARALLKLDPTHEEAARRLIQLKAAAGDVGGALGIYRTLWDLLEKEFDVEPSKETQDLVAAIRLAQPLTSAAPPGEAPAAGPTQLPAAHIVASGPGRKPQKLVISLGGFDATGVKDDHRYLVQGFRRELAACLVRFREWSVRDQAHVAAGAAPTIANDGEYIIDASAFETGESVRLIVMLREAATNTYIWSERLQLSLADWFEAQQAVVRRLSIALNVHISAERLVTLAHLPESNFKVYDQWLRAQALIYSYDFNNSHLAAEIYRKIIQDDPTFGPAYSGIANQQNVIHITHPGIFRDRLRTEETLRNALEGVRLDPIDSRAQLCLGWSHAMARQYDRAEMHFDLAYELNDTDAWTCVSSAHGVAFCGAAERGRARSEKALQLSVSASRAQWAFHVGIRFLAEDYDGCIAAADAARDHIPNLPGWKVAALARLGHTEKAEAELGRFFEVIRSKWVGDEPASEASITRWFLHLFPIAREGDWERLRDGLMRAGAPAGDLRHEAW